MIIVFTASTMISAGRSEAASVNTYAQVVISENDTLWDIACRYNPDYRDIRGIIHEIYEANDMTAADIIPGEVIFVPIH